MKFLASLFVVLSVLTIACNQTPPQNDKPINAAVEVAKPIAPTWAFKSKEDDMGNPRTQIFLVLKDTIKIAEETANFHDLTQAEYADKKIPKEAVIACSGFWAGLEHNYILIDSSNTWVVKRKYIDEGSDGKEVFESFVQFKK